MALRCRCRQGNCPSKIPECEKSSASLDNLVLKSYSNHTDEVFRLRRNIQSMTQAEEREWRRERLISASQIHRDRRIDLCGTDMCLSGFAIVVGGPNYLRVCFSTIRELREASASEGELYL